MFKWCGMRQKAQEIDRLRGGNILKSKLEEQLCK